MISGCESINTTVGPEGLRQVSKIFTIFHSSPFVEDSLSRLRSAGSRLFHIHPTRVPTGPKHQNASSFPCQMLIGGNIGHFLLAFLQLHPPACKKGNILHTIYSSSSIKSTFSDKVFSIEIPNLEVIVKRINVERFLLSNSSVNMSVEE